MLNTARTSRHHSFAKPRRVTRSLRLVTSHSVAQPKALLVCDNIQQAEQWRTALALAESEVAYSTEALSESLSLAIIDVTAEKLVETLKALRASDAPDDFYIFVAADQIVNAPQLAGVLPHYRALACGHGELIQLARRRLTGATPPPRKEMML
ncbi:MAG: hypothetical protein HOP19_29485 [Acidobacteria bacterium]|nr:hypothetical protein [Acidobacteriota bacterium]